MDIASTAFISLMIVALTQMVKMAWSQVTGWVTILIAILVGILVAIFSPVLGLPHMTIAEGLGTALSAIGITVVAGKAGGGSSGDQPR